MRLVVLILLVTGCSRIGSPVASAPAPAAPITGATCGAENPPPSVVKLEVTPPVHNVFDREGCR
jgi:hypothetical protein